MRNDRTGEVKEVLGPDRKSKIIVKPFALAIGSGLLLGSMTVWTACNVGPSKSLVESNPPTNQAQIDVEVVKPLREDLLRQITLPASFEAFQKTTLYSKVSGYLESIRVDIGDGVRKGQVIARIEVPEMFDQYQETEAQLASAKADHENAQAELESVKANLGLKEITYKRLHSVREEEPDVMPQQTVDEARAEFQVSLAEVKVIESRINQVLSKIRHVEATLNRLRTMMAYAEIKAPFAGVITDRFVDPGALIQAAITSQNVQPIVTVSDMKRLRLILDIPESETPFVQIRAPVLVTVDALPDRKFEGRVTRFATALNPSTRTMKTEIDIPNRERLLFPGMYGRVTLALEEHPEALTIPANALHVEDEMTFVYYVSDGVVKKAEVQIGFNDGIKIEVTRGLEGSETVIVGANGPLGDWVKVNSMQFLSPTE